MLKQIAIGALVAVGALGLVGTAAATCQSGATPAGGSYSVCALEYFEAPPGWGFNYYTHTLASASVSAPGGVASANAAVLQYGFDAAWGGITATYANAGASVAGAPVGVYAIQQGSTAGGFSDQQTSVTTYGPVPLTVGQYSSNAGTCYLYVAGIPGYQTQPCGPVPVAPTIPALPHL